MNLTTLLAYNLFCACFSLYYASLLALVQESLVFFFFFVIVSKVVSLILERDGAL